MDEILDLFGDPIPARHGKPGRPSHMPTVENRNKVIMLLALGWSNERIAGALRITPPTLRRHYFSELKCRDGQRDRMSAALAMRLWSEVQAGNVTAMREFQRFVDRNDGVPKEKPDEDDDAPALPASSVANWDDDRSGVAH